MYPTLPSLALVLAAQSYGAEIALRSGHADRGFVLSDRPVVQPVAWVSGSSAEFWVWGNLPLIENTDGSLAQIVEMELTHEQKWGRLTIGPAIRMWIYHDPLSPYSSRSFEGWLNLSYDAGAFRIFTNHSVDVRTYRGAYFGSAGIELKRQVSQTLEAGGSVAGGWASARFNDGWAGVPRSAFNRVSAEGWLTTYVNAHLYVGPRFEFSRILDRRVRAELARPTFFFVGLTTGVEF